MPASCGPGGWALRFQWYAPLPGSPGRRSPPLSPAGCMQEARGGPASPPAPLHVSYVSFSAPLTLGFLSQHPPALTAQGPPWGTVSERNLRGPTENVQFGGGSGVARRDLKYAAADSRPAVLPPVWRALGAKPHDAGLAAQEGQFCPFLLSPHALVQPLGRCQLRPSCARFRPLLRRVLPRRSPPHMRLVIAWPPALSVPPALGFSVQPHRPLPPSFSLRTTLRPPSPPDCEPVLGAGTQALLHPSGLEACPEHPGCFIIV